jgi:hypothetical protein
LARKIIPTEQSIPASISLIPTGIYHAKFISSVLMSNIRFLNSKNLLQESLTVMHLLANCHPILGISISGNNHCFFQNEPSTTKWIQLYWIQNAGLFMHLAFLKRAHETQKPQRK